MTAHTAARLERKATCRVEFTEPSAVARVACGGCPQAFFI